MLPGTCIAPAPGMTVCGGGCRACRGSSKETKGTAYVVYEDIYDAKTAVDHLSGFNVANRYLIVLYYNTSKQNKKVRCCLLRLLCMLRPPRAVVHPSMSRRGSGPVRAGGSDALPACVHRRRAQRTRRRSCGRCRRSLAWTASSTHAASSDLGTGWGQNACCRALRTVLVCMRAPTAASCMCGVGWPCWRCSKFLLRTPH